VVTKAEVLAVLNERYPAYIRELRRTDPIHFDTVGHAAFYPRLHTLAVYVQQANVTSSAKGYICFRVTVKTVYPEPIVVYADSVEHKNGLWVTRFPELKEVYAENIVHLFDLLLNRILPELEVRPFEWLRLPDGEDPASE
jgi:hypothetical protein